MEERYLKDFFECLREVHPPGACEEPIVSEVETTSHFFFDIGSFNELERRQRLQEKEERKRAGEDDKEDDDYFDENDSDQEIDEGRFEEFLAYEENQERQEERRRQEEIREQERKERCEEQRTRRSTRSQPVTTYKEGRTNKRNREENTLPHHPSMSTRSQVTERFRIWERNNPPAREEGEDEEQDGEEEKEEGVIIVPPFKPSYSRERLTEMNRRDQLSYFLNNRSCMPIDKNKQARKNAKTHATKGQRRKSRINARDRKPSKKKVFKKHKTLNEGVDG